MVDGANKINNDSVQNQYYKLAGINPDLVCNSNSKPLPLVNQPEDKNQPFAIGRNNIHFELPPNAPVEAVEFTDTLVKNKAKLMEELHINSDTYNMLAQTAVGIARKETNFGTDTGYKIRTAIRDSWIKYDRKFLNPSKHDFSMGMTQIKYTLQIKDLDIKQLMKEFNINEEWDLYNTEKSAIATMIVLSKMNEWLTLHEDLRNGLKKSNELFGTTKQDALCRLWNGDSKHEIANGTFNPDSQNWTYAKEVKKHCEEYKLISE